MTHNISTVLIQFINNNLDHMPTPKLQSLNIDSVHFLHQGCNNTFLRQHFVNTMYPGLTRGTHHLRKLLAIRTKFIKFSIPPKYKETHLKTINQIYPSNEFIRTRFKIDVDNCHLCTTNVETTEHLLFDCHMIQTYGNSCIIS